MMMVSIVTFRLPKRWTVEEAAAVFQSIAPKYLGKAGLVRNELFLVGADHHHGFEAPHAGVRRIDSGDCRFCVHRWFSPTCV